MIYFLGRERGSMVETLFAFCLHCASLRAVVGGEDDKFLLR